MKSMSRSRLTKGQMQAQLRQNARTLCSNCPNMSQTNGPLDDSLTSLQWLWNLNVNINPPFENRKDLETVSQEIKQESGHRAVHLPTNNVISDNKSNLACHFQQASYQSSTVSEMNSEHLCLCNHYSLIANSRNKAHGNKLATNQISHTKTDIPKKGVHTMPPKPVLNGKQKNSSEKSIQPQQFVGPLLSDAAKPYQTTILPPPSQKKLNVPQGSVDYKTNAYVRPPFSLVSLVCMALHKSKRSKMSASSIWKWIKDNFSYYRYSDSFGQKSIEQTLLKSKYFCKTQRKRKQQNLTFWQINQCHFTLRANKQSDLHESSAEHQQGISKSTSSGTILSTFAGRKRKQPSPQKRVCLQNNKQTCKCKESSPSESIDHTNLLQEQAPELGSLKGDYNWNSVFDEFFGNCNTGLPPQTVSMSSKTVSTPTQGNMLAGMMQGTEPPNTVVSQGDNVGDLNNENKFIGSDQSIELGTWNGSDVNDTMFSHCNDDYVSLDMGELSGGKEVDSLLIDVGDIDLTITGRQIEPPPEWVPVSGDIDAILCEKQEENLLNTTEGLCSAEDLSSLLDCGINKSLFIHSGTQCQGEEKNHDCGSSQHLSQTTSSCQNYKHHCALSTNEDNAKYLHLNPPKRKCLKF